MYRTGLIATWAVCAFAAGGTAWLGYDGGLFRLGEVGPGVIFSTLAPYLVLALLAWTQRRSPMPLGAVFALAVLVGGYGLFFFFNDWYWPPPTNPNPWRPWMIPVVVIPQWVVVGLAVAALTARFLWSPAR